MDRSKSVKDSLINCRKRNYRASFDFPANKVT